MLHFSASLVVGGFILRVMQVCWRLHDGYWTVLSLRSVLGLPTGYGPRFLYDWTGRLWILDRLLDCQLGDLVGAIGVALFCWCVWRAAGSAPAWVEVLGRKTGLSVKWLRKGH